MRQPSCKAKAESAKLEAAKKDGDQNSVIALSLLNLATAATTLVSSPAQAAVNTARRQAV